MKKIILIRYKNQKTYVIYNESHITRHSDLYDLYYALAPTEDVYTEIDDLEELQAIQIYSFDEIKRLEISDDDFNDSKKYAAINDAYDTYQTARIAEIPKVTISKQDWQDLQKQWKLIKKQGPKYIIITSDEAQPLQKVEIIGKDELSQQDLDDIKFENEKYLKFKKAKSRFFKDHPDCHYNWRGPQDNELDADIMKYYED